MGANVVARLIDFIQPVIGAGLYHRRRSVRTFDYSQTGESYEITCYERSLDRSSRRAFACSRVDELLGRPDKAVCIHLGLSHDHREW